MHILSMMTYSMDVKSLSKDLIFKIFKKAIADNANNSIVKEKIINFICQLCYYVDNAEYWNEFFENISSNYYLFINNYIYKYIYVTLEFNNDINS